MKAIVDLTKDEYANQLRSWDNLKLAVADLKKDELFREFGTAKGYAHYTFHGEVHGHLIEALGRMPTPSEIIMLVDHGFSHFGASCSLSGRRFSGRVNTD